MGPGRLSEQVIVLARHMTCVGKRKFCLHFVGFCGWSKIWKNRSILLVTYFSANFVVDNFVYFVGTKEPVDFIVR